MISKIFNDFLHPELLLHGTDLSTLLLMDKIDIITEWLYKHKKQNDSGEYYDKFKSKEFRRSLLNFKEYVRRINSNRLGCQV